MADDNKKASRVRINLTGRTPAQPKTPTPTSSRVRINLTGRKRDKS